MAILTSQEQRWVDTRLVQIQSDQSNYAILYAKYQQLSKTTFGNITVEAHETISPSGKIGYMVFLYKTVNGIIYRCGYGFGDDMTNNTFEWREFFPATR